MRAEDDDTILEMSEKHRSQKPLTVEDVEESGFYFLEKPHEMLISLAFQKREPALLHCLHG